MITFKNSVVWITGASSGIGEALAYQFIKEGSKVVLSARRQEELERVKKNCNTTPEKILILPFDLTDTKMAEKMTSTILAHFGKIDILINNGGISQRSFAKDTPLEIDRKIMEVNYFGSIAVTKSVLPHMIEQNSGKIIVISSISGKFGFYLRSAYAASKHALHGFFESLRLEVFKNNISVLLVCPGKIKTNISINAINEHGDKHNKMDSSQEKGLSADTCAIAIINAIKQNKEEVLIGGKEIKAVWIKRMLPKLFTKIIRKQKVE